MKNSAKIKFLTTSIITISAFGVANATPQLDAAKSGSNVGVSSVKTVGLNTTVKQDKSFAV